LVENADTGLCCGHCVVRGTGHNSKTCPEHARIMVIKRPVLEEPWKEHPMKIVVLQIILAVEKEEL